MSVCSNPTHTPEKNPECRACQATMYDLFPDWDQAVARAKAAGKFKCKCGFVYYLTTNMCPLCCRVLKGEKITETTTEDTESGSGKKPERKTSPLSLLGEALCRIFHW